MGRGKQACVIFDRLERMNMKELTDKQIIQMAKIEFIDNEYWVSKPRNNVTEFMKALGREYSWDAIGRFKTKAEAKAFLIKFKQENK